MYIPKRYGQSKIDSCAFCEKRGLYKNKQGLITCQEHKDSYLPDIRCVCKSYLELKQGKFGPFFVCINCGIISLKKGMDMLNGMQEKEKPKIIKEEKDEFILDSGKYPGFDYGIR